MSRFATRRAREFYAETYEATVADWPGEIEYYRKLAAEAHAQGQLVLEVACGTGRVAVQLAREGVRVVGLDLSAVMLDVARQKSAGLDNVHWIEGDMRSFDLGQSFALCAEPCVTGGRYSK